MNAEGTDGEYLVIVDADRIHDYVFSPHQLKLIRGGSRILRDLSDDVLPEIAKGEPFNGEIVVAAGGKLIAIFRNKVAAEGFVQEMNKTFRMRTAIATATSISVPMGEWKETLAPAEAMLERKKTGRQERRFSGGSPYWKSCDSCGLHPSACLYPDPDGDHFPCEACLLRHEKGKAKRQGEPNDFEELSKESVPEGYLALIYLDGNRMGKYLSSRGSISPEAYKNASDEVHKAVDEGVTKGCEATKKSYQVLLIGGDDAIVMLPAQSVFPFLKAFVQNCNLPKVTFSAGVVWANHHFPIAQFVRRAASLLGAAKRANSGLADPKNRVDFEIVTESMTLATRHAEERWTARPYSMEDLDGLVDAIREWKTEGMPSNKVKALYEISRMEEEQAVLEYCFLLSRLDEENRSRMLQQVEARFWSEGLQPKTKAGDLAELWDFVRSDEDEANTADRV